MRVGAKMRHPITHRSLEQRYVLYGCLGIKSIFRTLKIRADLAHGLPKREKENSQSFSLKIQFKQCSE